MMRRAVGAVVVCGGEFLLVHKVKVMGGKGGPQRIRGEWGFLKGGVEAGEFDLRDAVLRELEEETGSSKYDVLRQFDAMICFSFSKSVQELMGYEGQETTMFLVRYVGDKADLSPADDEIDDIKFFKKDDVIKVLAHEESRDFFLEIMGEVKKGIWWDKARKH